jgi:SSS family solute:Na+ symporter
MILIAAATLLANNVVRAFRPQMSANAVSSLARLLVPVLALISVWFTLQGGSTIVALLLMGYAFVTQLFPVLIASLLPRNPVTKEAAFAGIVVGVATVAVISLTHTTIGKLFPSLPQTMQDLNIGIVALVLNVAALALVSAVTHRRAAYA